MVEALPNLDYRLDARYRLVARSADIFMKRMMEESFPGVRLRESVDTAVKQHEADGIAPGANRFSFHGSEISPSKAISHGICRLQTIERSNGYHEYLHSYR